MENEMSRRQINELKETIGSMRDRFDNEIKELKNEIFKLKYPDGRILKLYNFLGQELGWYYRFYKNYKIYLDEDIRSFQKSGNYLKINYLDKYKDISTKIYKILSNNLEEIDINMTEKFKNCEKIVVN
jgi:gas vesicle protein